MSRLRNIEEYNEVRKLMESRYNGQIKEEKTKIEHTNSSLPIKKKTITKKTNKKTINKQKTKPTGDELWSSIIRSSNSFNGIRRVLVDDTNILIYMF